MKLSEHQLDALRAIDAGEERPKAAKQTLRSLWQNGLIVDIKPQTITGGWTLTLAGKNALKHGRLMMSGRSEPSAGVAPRRGVRL